MPLYEETLRAMRPAGTAAVTRVSSIRVALMF